MNFAEIPKLVINLPERKDRLNQFNEELKHLNATAIVIPGVTHPKSPMLGIAQAHINALTWAQTNDWDNVLIMEDDVVFHAKERTLPYLNEALKHIPEDWNVLLGGVYESKAMTPVNGYWQRTSEFCSLHFYIVNSKSYDLIMAGYDERTHFDRWVNKGGKKLNAYVLRKFIATQREGFSDNVKKNVNYVDRIKRFELL